MKKLFAIALASTMLSGCVDKTDIALIEQKQAALEQKITALEAEKAAITEKLTALEVSFFVAHEIKNMGYLTPGSDGYAVVRFDLGELTIGIEDIQPYANGSKVKIRFGNPLAATINGLNMTIDWGAVDKQGHADNNTAKTKRLEVKESIKSSSWTSATVILEGITPDKLGFIRVKDMSHRGIRLSVAQSG